MAGSRADLHVLCCPGREAWRAALLGDLDREPCAVHLAEPAHEPGGIGYARAEAFRHGSAPYVGFADDDDRVITGAVSACVAALEANPDAVGAYTDEQYLDESGRVIRTPTAQDLARPWSLHAHVSDVLHVHHLWIARRASVLRYAEDAARFRVRTGWILTALMAQDGPWVKVPMVGYQWRHHHGGAHHTRAGDPRAATLYVAQSVLCGRRGA